MYFLLAALSVAIAYATFQAGAVAAWDWDVTLLGTSVTSAIYFATRRQRRPLDRLSTALIAVFIGLAAFQWVPLPAALVKALSPTRWEDMAATAAVTGTIPDWFPLSTAPYETAQYLITLTGCLVVLLAIRAISLEERNNRWIMIWPLLAIGAFQATLGFFQAYAEGGGGMATGTYASRDHYAGLLEMILPFALLYPVSILQRDRKRHESPALPAIKACCILAIAAVLLIGIIHSLSRMGFLATLASIFVCGAVTVSMRGWRIDYEVGPVPLWRRVLPAVIVALIVVAGFVFLPTDPLIARFSDLARTDDISADTRAQIWRDSVGLIKAYPIFGCGWGAYETAFLRFKTVAPMFTVDYAHNDYLQVLAEAGVLAFIAGLLFLLRLLWKTIRAATYASSFDERYLAIACIGSFIAILLHSAVDFNLYVPANSMLLAWVLGVAAVNLRRRAVTS